MKKGEEIMWNLQDNNKKNNKHTIGNTATEKGTDTTASFTFVCDNRWHIKYSEAECIISFEKFLISLISNHVHFSQPYQLARPEGI